MIAARTLLAPFALLLAVSGQVSASDLSVASVFGDHMVLQRETEVALWGRANPGEGLMIETSWDNRSTSIGADDDGRWRVDVRTPKAGGPYTITIDSRAGATLELKDVLIGEVWICSGQSNMEWPMTAINDSESEIASANRPAIRLFDVAHQVSMQPEGECNGTWQICTPETVSRFSAVGYLFARELNDALDVPIGLLGSNWGGTVAESWTSARTLREHLPEFDGALDRVDAAIASPDSEESIESRQAAWWANLESTNPGATGEWNAATLPGTWADLDLAGFDGCLWYRREVEIPATLAGAELTLELGPIDDMDLTWFNGHLVGAARRAGHHASPRRYTVPAGTARAGTNTIVVCAVDTGGVGRMGSDPAGMRLRRGGGVRRNADRDSVSLAGEWSYRRGAAMSDLGAFPRSGWFHQNSPTALSNGMIEPLVPFAIRGAIWYQGESNRTRAAQYRRLFPAMINDWRRRFDQGAFPFYFVQIAPYGYGGDTGQAAQLREAQAMTVALENTGMAVTMDIGNPRDIHPRNKQDVAHRLALLALANDYGHEGLEFSGPIYRSMKIDGKSVVLTFDHAQGLTSGAAPPSHFTIAGADHVFHPATATIDGATIVVRSGAVASPKAVRYAWGAADQPNLANGAGLPASSFRTDEW